MQFLVIYQPPQRFADEGTPDDFAELDVQEEARLRELYGAGSARQAWALDSPYRGAAVVYEADSVEELEQINGSYPLVQHGYSVYQVYPLAPYPGLVQKS